jgi:hypothetical protein
MRLVCSEHSRSSAWHAVIRSSGVREAPAATDAWKVQEGSPRRGQSQNRAPRLTELLPRRPSGRAVGRRSHRHVAEHLRARGQRPQRGAEGSAQQEAMVGLHLGLWGGAEESRGGRGGWSHISPISPPHLPHTSPTSPPYLPHISPTPPPSRFSRLVCTQPKGGGRLGARLRDVSRTCRGRVVDALRRRTCPGQAPEGRGAARARLIGEAVGHAGPKALHAHRPEERQSRRPLGEPCRLHHPLRNLREMGRDGERWGEMDLHRPFRKLPIRAGALSGWASVAVRGGWLQSPAPVFVLRV